MMAAGAVVTPYTVSAGADGRAPGDRPGAGAAGATAVVLTRAPVRQVIVLSGYGLLLAVLFLVFQAPDVTLSELTVGAVALPLLLLLALAKVRRAGEVTPRQRAAGCSWPAMAGLAACYLWGLAGLPGFGHYPGPYGDIINHIAVGQTNATGVVSAVNFEYRGLRHRGRGVHPVRRGRRGEPRCCATCAASGSARPGTRRRTGTRRRPATRSGWWRWSSPGPTVVIGWYLASHAQTSPSGGFQGGVVLATAFILIYLSGQFLVFKRFSPVDVTDAVEAVGAGGFAAVGLGRGGDGPALPVQLPAARAARPAR